MFPSYVLYVIPTLNKLAIKYIDSKFAQNMLANRGTEIAQ